MQTELKGLARDYNPIFLEGAVCVRPGDLLMSFVSSSFFHVFFFEVHLQADDTNSEIGGEKRYWRDPSYKRSSSVNNVTATKSGCSRFSFLFNKDL